MSVPQSKTRLLLSVLDLWVTGKAQGHPVLSGPSQKWGWGSSARVRSAWGRELHQMMGRDWAREEGWLWKGRSGGGVVAVPGGPSWKGRPKRSDLFCQTSCLLADAENKHTVLIAVAWGLFGQREERSRGTNSWEEDQLGSVGRVH